MKTLITGVTGLIGPHLAEACLSKGWGVLGVSRSSKNIISDERFRYIKKDVTALTEEDLEGVDYVFHLAFSTNLSYGVEHPLESTAKNIGMTTYLLDLCAKANVKKIIFASSATIYGNNPIPWNEGMEPSLLEPYSWQKFSCEGALKMWRERFGLPGVSLRFFQIFGENYREDSVFKVFADAKKKGGPLPVTAIEKNGKIIPSERDFVFVKDVADACINAAESTKVGNGEVINISSGESTSMLDIAKLLGEKIDYIPLRKFEVLLHQGDPSKAKELLGWEAKINIIEWLKENSSRLFLS